MLYYVYYIPEWKKKNKGAIGIIQIIGAPQNVVCSHPAPATGNLCDVPNVRLINRPDTNTSGTEGGRVLRLGTITLPKIQSVMS